MLRFAINPNIFIQAVVIGVICLMGPTILSARPADFEDTVEAIGTAPIQGEAIQASRDQAIADSLAASVAIAAGKIAPLDAIVRNFKTLNEVLYGHTDEFVQDYKVLTELKTGSQYRVLVQATVRADKIKAEMERLGIIIGLKSIPRILFLMAEQNIDDLSPRYSWDLVSSETPLRSEKAMAEIMRQKGLILIDSGAMAPQGQTMPAATAPVDDRTALMLGLKMQADVVVIGSASVIRSANTMGAYNRSLKGVVTARALHTLTGAEASKDNPGSGVGRGRCRGRRPRGPHKSRRPRRAGPDNADYCELEEGAGIICRPGCRCGRHPQPG